VPSAGNVFAFYDAVCLVFPHITGTGTLMLIGISTSPTFVPAQSNVNSKEIEWGAALPTMLIDRRSCSVSAMLPVSAGTHTIYARGIQVLGGVGSNTRVDSQHLNLLFVPATY